MRETCSSTVVVRLVDLDQHAAIEHDAELSHRREIVEQICD
jgi:hypothetical protein